MGYGKGSEQFGVRPVLIIQNDTGNKFSPTVIVASITDARKRYMPTHIRIKPRQGLQKDSIVLLEQIRTIDKVRITDHMADLSEAEMIRVDEALALSIGIGGVSCQV